MKMIEKFYIYVEGNDDKRLIDHVVKKCFQHYEFKFFKYAHAPQSSIHSTIKKHIADRNLHLMLADMDNFDSIDARKKHCHVSYGIDEKNVMVVNKEIESWYIAGSDLLPAGMNAEDVDKEKFNEIIGKEHHTTAIIRILRNFNVERAGSASPSFKYFYDKIKLLANPV